MFIRYFANISEPILMQIHTQHTLYQDETRTLHPRAEELKHLHMSVRFSWCQAKLGIHDNSFDLQKRGAKIFLETESVFSGPFNFWVF